MALELATAFRWTLNSIMLLISKEVTELTVYLYVLVKIGIDLESIVYFCALPLP